MTEKIRHRSNISRVETLYQDRPIDHYWYVKCYVCPYFTFPRFWDAAIYLANRHALRDF